MAFITRYGEARQGDEKNVRSMVDGVCVCGHLGS